MKKILFHIVIFIGMTLNICFADSICYYIPYEDSNGWDLPLNNCKAFEKLAKSLGEISVDIMSIDNLDISKANLYNIVYISSYGTPDGIIKKVTGEAYETIPWESVAEINVQLLLIDTCFPGFVFDYDYKADIVITSAYKTPSWNILVGGENLSSFVVMLRCIFDYDYDCPIHIRQCCKINSMFLPDPEVCQFNLIVRKLFQEMPGIFTIDKWKPLSLSTAYINGEPWR